MKKSILVICVSLLVGGILFFSMRDNESKSDLMTSKEPSITPTVKTTQIPKALVPIKLPKVHTKDTFKGNVAQFESVQKCDTASSAILQVSTHYEIAGSLEENNVESLRKSCPADFLSKGLIENTQKACMESQTSAECLKQFASLKMELVKSRTLNLKPAEIDDPNIISSRIASAMREDDMETAWEFGERLFQLDKQSYNAAKLAAFHYFREGVKKAKKKPEDPLWGKMDDAISAMESNTSGNIKEKKEIVEYKLIRLVFSGETEGIVEPKFKELEMNNPESFSQVEYWRAAYEFGKKDKAAGKARLELLGKRKDVEPRVKRILDSIRENPDGEQGFSPDVSFAIEVH